MSQDKAAACASTGKRPFSLIFMMRAFPPEGIAAAASSMLAKAFCKSFQAKLIGCQTCTL